MPEIVDIDTARAAYAQWFVKRHYLKKHYSPNGEWLSNWSRAKGRGYIRFFKRQWPEDDPIRKGSLEIRDEYDDDYWPYMLGNRPDRSWWRITLADLDNPENDDHPIAERYRRYRKHAEEMAVVNWLLAEAEFHIVTNEAWLRAYGVDVIN